MAKSCDICGKGALAGHKISHAHNVSAKRWQVNLRSVRALVDGRTVRLNVCTRCLRSGKVVKAVR
jgi:large subunit ribosomal protein L28